jgi:hypothetical protein
MKNEKESNTIRNLEIRYSHQVTDTPNVTESSEMLFKITRLLRGKNCCLHVSRIFLFQDEKKKKRNSLPGAINSRTKWIRGRKKKGHQSNKINTQKEKKTYRFTVMETQSAER